MEVHGRVEEIRGTRLDIARRSERQRDWESCYCTRKRKNLRTPIGLTDESKESLHGRETDRDLRSVCRCVT